MSGWQLWAILSALFAALTAIFAKIGVQGIAPDVATFIRTGIVLALLFVLLSVTAQWSAVKAIGPQGYGSLALSGFATGASWLCYFRALKLGNAAQVAAIDKLSVVFVAVIAVTLLGEKLTALNWLGLILIGAGAVLVALR